MFLVGSERESEEKEEGERSEREEQDFRVTGALLLSTDLGTRPSFFLLRWKLCILAYPPRSFHTMKI